jgi:hypothetical protein
MRFCGLQMKAVGCEKAPHPPLAFARFVGNEVIKPMEQI